MEPNVGLVKKTREQESSGLGLLLADTYTLYLKTQFCHWNVRGAEWYPLHLLFESHYKEMAEAVDVIAERIGALGFFVDASLASFKAKTKIKEDAHSGSSKDFIVSLLDGHETIIRQVRELIDGADRDRDALTVDLLVHRLGAHEKMAWFLRNYLG